MSLNQSMNIALGSLKNNQYAMTVVSQNIANVNVEGYRRQRVDFQTNEYTTNCSTVISTIKGMNGASISSLTDYANDGAFRDKLDTNSDAQYYNTLNDALSGLEDIADDLGDNGLNNLLNEFYTAAANLEKYPTDMSIRQQYVLAAQNVCDKFNEVSKKYDNLQQDTFDTVQTNTDIVNSLLKNLAELNEAHIKNNQGPSTQSQIESVLEELSNYIDITTDKNANGTINVYIGNTAVVQGCEQKYTLNAQYDPQDKDNAVKFSLQSTENEAYVIENGVNEAIKSGSMKAYIDFLNGSGEKFANVNDMKEALNSAATAFANAMNAIQTYDNGDVFAASLTTDADGNVILEKATEAMFVASDGAGVIDASNIKVNANIVENPFLVSAARIDLNDFKDETGAVDPSWVNAIGNSDNATEITALQNAKICSYGGGNNNCTLSQFLINNAAKNGLDAANIASKAETYQDIADSSAMNYANLIGVNIDEELADMIKFQRAYEASAKLFSTVNDLFGVVINMV